MEFQLKGIFKILSTWQGLLTQDDLAKVPFVILGNKIDIPTAVPEEVLKQNLGVIPRSIFPPKMKKMKILGNWGGK